MQALSAQSSWDEGLDGEYESGTDAKVLSDERLPGLSMYVPESHRVVDVVCHPHPADSRLRWSDKVVQNVGLASSLFLAG
jgi:hypothetical protein